MAKANKKATKSKENKQVIQEGFKNWEETLDKMIDNAEKSLMPLLADTFRFGKKVLDVYKKAYTDYFE